MTIMRFHPFLSIFLSGILCGAALLIVPSGCSDARVEIVNDSLRVYHHLNRTDILLSTSDTWQAVVRSNAGDSTDTSADSIIVSLTPDTAYTLLYLDIIGLPVPSTIDSAKLILQGNAESANVALFVINESWKPALLAWDNLPGTGFSGFMITKSGDGQYTSDITGFIKNIAALPSVNYGLMFKIVGSGQAYFYGTGYPDKLKRPQLEIFIR